MPDWQLKKESKKTHELSFFIEKNSYQDCTISSIFVHNPWSAIKVFYLFSWDHLANLAAMTNQQLIDVGRNQMDQTDQAIERSKMVASLTIYSCPVSFSAPTWHVLQDFSLVGCSTNCWDWSTNCCNINTASMLFLYWIDKLSPSNYVFAGLHVVLLSMMISWNIPSSLSHSIVIPSWDL